MPTRITTEQHTWVGAATVNLDTDQARYAQWRGYVDVARGIRVQVVETYCATCRRPYEDVVGEICVAAESNEHLRGGPIGERKKRKHSHHDCELLGCDRDTVGVAGLRSGA